MSSIAVKQTNKQTNKQTKHAEIAQASIQNTVSGLKISSECSGMHYLCAHK